MTKLSPLDLDRMSTINEMQRAADFLRSDKSDDDSVADVDAAIASLKQNDRAFPGSALERTLLGRIAEQMHAAYMPGQDDVGHDMHMRSVRSAQRLLERVQ